MTNKRGIQLTINFMVMLVLAIVVFGLSVAMVNKFFGSAKKMKVQLDDQTNRQIERYLDEGSKVAVPLKRKNIERKELGRFGVGILNVFPDQYKFRVKITPGKAFTTQKEDIAAGWFTRGEWKLLYNREELIIKNDGKEVIPVGIVVGNAGEGTYIFDVVVERYYDHDDDPNVEDYKWGDEPYGNLEKIYVTVI